jgi:hypothetical protein
VQVRFLQYFAKKEKGELPENATMSMKRMSMATKSGEVIMIQRINKSIKKYKKCMTKN